MSFSIQTFWGFSRNGSKEEIKKFRFEKVVMPISPTAGIHIQAAALGAFAHTSNQQFFADNFQSMGEQFLCLFNEKRIEGCGPSSQAAAAFLAERFPEAVQYHLKIFDPAIKVTSPVMHKMATGFKISVNPAASVNTALMESASSVSGKT